MTGIVLFLLDRSTADHLAADPAAFADQHDIELAPHESTAVMIAAATAQMLAKGDAVRPWGGYLALGGPRRRVVGTGGFKGDPDATNSVEVAYFTFPGEEGRGVATAMAQALVRLAGEAHAEVLIVCAHTLPERTASSRVLENAGFKQVSTVLDPVDGPVWRWELRVRAS